MKRIIKSVLITAVAWAVAGFIFSHPLMQKLSPASIDWTWPKNCERASLNEFWGDHFVCVEHREKI